MQNLQMMCVIITTTAITAITVITIIIITIKTRPFEPDLPLAGGGNPTGKALGSQDKQASTIFMKIIMLAMMMMMVVVMMIIPKQD